MSMSDGCLCRCGVLVKWGTVHRCISSPQPSAIKEQREAWICPKCNKGKAPHVDECNCNGVTMRPTPPINYTGTMDCQDSQLSTNEENQ